MKEQSQKLKESLIDYNIIAYILRAVFYNKIDLNDKLKTDLYKETMSILSEELGIDKQAINSLMFVKYNDLEFKE